MEAEAKMRTASLFAHIFNRVPRVNDRLRKQNKQRKIRNIRKYSENLKYLYKNYFILLSDQLEIDF